MIFDVFSTFPSYFVGFVAFIAFIGPLGDYFEIWGIYMQNMYRKMEEYRNVSFTAVRDLPEVFAPQSILL